jgi:hypothetical protein
LFALALAACGGSPAGKPTSPSMTRGAQRLAGAGHPRLVVLVIIDQWPEWAFEVKHGELRDGFARLLSQGEWHIGRYPTAATLTGPDHALLGTGATPNVSGIVADEWWHRDLGAALESVHDSDGSLSAKWLRVGGLGDAIAAAHGDGKAVGVALKPRAAILPLGHHGLPIWYDWHEVKWASSAAPPWLDDYNRTHPIADHVHDVWTPLDATRLAQLAQVDDGRAGEVGGEALGPTFPHDPGATPTPAKALLATPTADALLFDLATQTIDSEQLGTHHATDLLVIGVSAHDYVGHAWGQESWEMWDLELRLDARLGRFIADLDHRLGENNWAMIVTSDHGASPLPESVGGGRLVIEQLQRAANNAASAVLGDGHWIEQADYPYLYFSKAMLAQSKGELAAATTHVMYALRAFPGIARVGRVADFSGHCELRHGDDQALCAMFAPGISGELFYLPAKGWTLESEHDHTATAHGSMYDYDRLVPVIVLPPGRTRHVPQPSPSHDELDMRDIAPLVAHWLGVKFPPPAPVEDAVPAASAPAQ